MYFFDRKTIYFVWYREDGQAKGVGSARLTAVENVCRIEVSVTNCGRVEGEFPCYLLSGPVESLLGLIRLQKGRGTLSVRCDADRIGHKQVPYEKLTGMHIDLKKDGYLEQKWLPMEAGVRGQAEKRTAVVEEPEHVIGDVIPYRRKENDTEKNTEQLRESRSIQKKGEEKHEEVPLAGVGQGETENLTEEKDAEQKKAGNINVDEAWEVKLTGQRPVQLYSDKWQQLCAIYPIVHPFGDARGYLSIEPRDFVVLQERYQAMTQNSFLLHGFYNYRHLLLGRKRGEREMQYYLGVPGVLHEKERAAALFYGFEVFESASAPAPMGSFGYYMKRVQI
ncbi:MAG: hypothetical protein LUI10_03195 [Lachnospiraceae bacterium]|nr:hypothetical protein [Lachnospiraceae bacterium]